MRGFEKSLEKAREWTIPTLTKKVAKDLQLCIRMEAAVRKDHLCIVRGEPMKYWTPLGICACVTCGEVAPYSMMHAGHFLPSRRNSILLDERGINCQCNHCNTFLSGNPGPYHQWMLHVHGQEVIDDLEHKKNCVSRKFDREELVAFRMGVLHRIKVAKGALKNA